jgi:hypothetical protein
MTSKEAALEVLGDPDSGARLIFHVPAGGEIRAAVTEHLAEVGATRSCLVVTMSRLRAQLWRVALARAARRLGGAATVVDLADASDDLPGLADEGVSVVAVASMGRLRNTAAVRILHEFEWDVIVFDELSNLRSVRVGVPESTVSATVIEGLAGLARSSVALVDGTVALDWPGARVALPLTEGEFDRSVSGVAAESVRYGQTATPTRRIDEVRESLRSLVPDFHWVSTDASSVELHQIAVDLASSVDSGTPAYPVESVTMSRAEVSETAWRLADELESLADVAGDARLDAIATLVRHSADGWVIVAHARSDMALIADHLRALGVAVAVVNSEVSPEDRRSILLDPPHVVVMSPVLALVPGLWPLKYNGLWWSAPRDRGDHERRMMQIADAGGSRSVSLVPADA